MILTDNILNCEYVKPGIRRLFLANWVDLKYSLIYDNNNLNIIDTRS